MPHSKRSKLVSLTKVSKKTREHKNALLNEIQQSAEKWSYCWLFEVGAMRNTHLKTCPKSLERVTRIFFGRAAVMAKALGNTPEAEHRPGLHKLAEKIKGQVGLLFTDTDPEEVIEWFEDFQQADFARTGNIASRTVILPAGPVMRVHSDPPEPFPHNEEPQLRKLGLSTTLKRGVPTLEASHKICDKGKALTSEQAQLLKLSGEKMVVFKVGLKARWDSKTGQVIQMDSAVSAGDENEGEQMDE
ncbi:ribosomal protein L10-domain-containing protein [Chiua virens]|nr:ribosomal protein L10-domain-containing protein [Chiua virens]